MGSPAYDIELRELSAPVISWVPRFGNARARRVTFPIASQIPRRLILPRVTRVAVIRDLAGAGQFGAIQSVAPSFGVELTPIGLRDAGEIERSITAFARSANGGCDGASSSRSGRRWSSFPVPSWTDPEKPRANKSLGRLVNL
jgi:hypothetical protein